MISKMNVNDITINNCLDKFLVTGVSNVPLGDNFIKK